MPWRLCCHQRVMSTQKSSHIDKQGSGDEAETEAGQDHMI